jgi:hypothetical protein
MARTKQTARKSNGGKAPRKQVQQHTAHMNTHIKVGSHSFKTGQNLHQQAFSLGWLLLVAGSYALARLYRV